MSQEQGEFVFVMLKPAAAKDTALSNFIENKLRDYGDIQQRRKNILVSKEKILKHYKSSNLSFWYPIITNYLSNKSVEYFVLEKNSTYDGSDYCSFGEFLKTQVIGPANICKTKKNHLRRLALKKATFLFDNLIHCSDNTKEALGEIRIWYDNEPMVIAEFETKGTPQRLIP